MIIIEKTSYHSRFQKAAPIGVEKLACAGKIGLRAGERLRLGGGANANGAKKSKNKKN